MVVVAVMCPPLIVSNSDTAQNKGTLIVHRVAYPTFVTKWTTPDKSQYTYRKVEVGVRTACGKDVGFVLAYGLEKPTRPCGLCKKNRAWRARFDPSEPFVGLFTYGGEGAVPAPLGETRLGKPSF